MTESVGDVALLRFLSDRESNSIRRSLEVAGYEVFENPCFQIELPNQPGEFSRLTRILAEEEIKILNAYGLTNSGESARLTLVVDKPERTQSVLARLTEKVAVAA